MIPSASIQNPEQAEAVFTKFVRDWLRLLARGEFDLAGRVFDEPNDYGQSWTGEELRRELFEYARRSDLKVTDADVLGVDPYQSSVPFSDGSGYSFYCTVPFEGEWSDLTAQFEFMSRPNGFAVRLHSLHVL